MNQPATEKVFHLSEIMPWEGSDPIKVGSYVITIRGEYGRKRVTAFLTNHRVCVVDDPYVWED